MKKVYTILFLIGLLVVPLVYAQGTMLSFKTIKAIVDGKKESGTSIDVKPNSTVKIEIEVRNDYATSLPDDQTNIEGIDLTATIKGIDDGDDLEESVDSFDLGAGDTKTKSVTFKIPLEVDEADFDLDITATGTDGNDTEHTAEETLTISVNKDQHNVIFTQARLSRNTIDCSGSTIIEAEVMNLGSEPEDNAELIFSNENLNLNQKDVFDLSEDYSDEENTHSKSYSLNVQNISAGTYPIELTGVYDDGQKTVSTTLELQVLACPQPKPEPKPEETEEEKKEKEEVVVIPEPPLVIPPQVVQPEPEPYWQKFSWVFIGFAYVLVIGIFVIIGVKMFRRD